MNFVLHNKKDLESFIQLDDVNPLQLCCKGSRIMLFPYRTTVRSLPPPNLQIYYHFTNVCLSLLIAFFYTCSNSSHEGRREGRWQKFYIFWFLAEARIFLLSKASRPSIRLTQSPIQWVLWALLPGVKCPRNKADHSPPTSAKFNNEWNYTSTVTYAFMMDTGTTYFLVKEPFLLMFLAQDLTYS